MERKPYIHRLYAVISILALLSSSLVSAAEDKALESKVLVEYNKTTEQNDALKFGTGGVHELRISADRLSDARIISAGSLIFMLPGDSYFSMETVSESDYDFKDIDMSSYPELILGLQGLTDEASDFHKELRKSYLHVIKPDVSPKEIRIFNTANGKGYWAVGNKKSIIILSSKEVDNQFSYFYIRNLSESDIEEIIINGLL